MGSEFMVFPESFINGSWKFVGLTHEGNPASAYSCLKSSSERFVRKVFPAITPDRGLPEDVSAEVSAWLYESAEISDAGWLLLSEVLAFDWHNNFDQKGWWEDGVREALLPFQSWPIA